MCLAVIPNDIEYTMIATPIYKLGECEDVRIGAVRIGGALDDSVKLLDTKDTAVK